MVRIPVPKLTRSYSLPPRRNRDEEPNNTHETPARQAKQNNQLSLPHQCSVALPHGAVGWVQCVIVFFPNHTTSLLLRAVG